MQPTVNPSRPPAWRSTRLGWLCRPAIRPWQFLLLYTAYTALAFQWPTWAFAAQHLDLSGPEGWRTLGSLALLLGLLMHLALGLPALLSLRLLKALAVLLLLANGLVTYFMHSYQVVMDVEMMGNVLRTRPGEASDLLHPSMLLWMGLLSGLPAWWVWRLRWVRSRRRVQALQWAAALAAASLWLYLNAATWLWLDRHMSRIGAMTPPWSYLVNGARFLHRERLAQRPLALLPALAADANTAGGPRRVVVLVIGESARAANFSLYGYERETNPLLRRQAVEVLPARACASYTTAALACMLSAQGNEVDDHPPEESLPSYLHRHGVDVEWRSNNFGEPRMTVSSRVSATELAQACDQHAQPSEQDQTLCKQARERSFDGNLLLGLERRILASGSRQVLIVMHQTGSHGPVYHEKYPQAAEAFKPACKTVSLGACPPGTLLNAYDNSIVYTDALLSQIIDRLRSLADWHSTLIYISDHGESLGEGGLYLHGTPAALAPKVQMDIPFLIWRSHGTGEPAPGPRRRAGAYGHDNVFHTVLGALDRRGGAYRAERDLGAAPGPYPAPTAHTVHPQPVAKP